MASGVSANHIGLIGMSIGCHPSLQAYDRPPLYQIVARTEIRLQMITSSYEIHKTRLKKNLKHLRSYWHFEYLTVIGTFLDEQIETL
jgi:hypothetical protein